MKKVILLINLLIISVLSVAGYNAVGDKDWSEGGAYEPSNTDYTRWLGTLSIQNHNDNKYKFNLFNSPFLKNTRDYTVREGKQARIALGWYAQAMSPGSVALGTDSSAYGNGTSAFGAGASAIGYQNTALGMFSVALGRQSIALGSYSLANEDNILSVGNDWLKRRITNVDRAVNNNDVVIKEQLDEEITKVNTKIDTEITRIDNEITIMNENIARIDNKIDETKVTLNTKIEDIREDYTSKYNNLNTNIDKLQKNIETNEEKFKEYVKDELDKNRVQLKEDIALNNEKIREENKVYTNEIMAQAIAIAGLFQPVVEEVGNISIGFGGYNKNVAVAIGGGYKVNEFFSFRAGISTNFKSGAAYNAAINFEF